MKHFFNYSILVMFFLASTFTASFAQLPWTKDVNNPVLSGGAPGSWNRHLYWPSVLYNTDSVRYEMWYSGSSGTPTRPMNIGFATSTDGVNWNHHGPAVLTPGTGGSWDDSSVEIPWVVLEDTVYKMWYSGWNSSNQEWSVGYATSPDGINWTKHTNPVMTQGPAAWEAGGVVAGSILYNADSARYDMWYSGYTGAFIGNIGYATSTDGITWTKYPGNPVLTNGGSGTWDEDTDDIPRVLYYDNLYHMWFTGIPDSYNIPWQIGWATSVDGIHWNKHNDPNTTTQFYSESDPVLSADNNQWDGSRLQVGTVIRAGDSLHFWYTGVLNPSATNLWRIGHATAPFTMPTTILVPDDLPTIQAAIDSASDGNLVLVADGTYLENINFKGKAITVASHYYIDGDTTHIDNTIIDGSNPSDPDSGSVVFFISGEDSNSVLYGFSITGGTGTISEYDWLGTTYTVRTGGGIFCYNSGARISHNYIMNNHIPSYVESAGGGISGFPIGSNEHIIIEHNQILNDTLSGDYTYGSAINMTCNATIKNNDITLNESIANITAWGAVNCWTEGTIKRSVKVQNNYITENQSNGQYGYGGGIEIQNGMNASISGNDITDNIINASNQAYGGGIRIIGRNGSTIINQNFIANNTVTSPTARGGGISLSNNNVAVSNTLIINNIISGNSAAEGGGIHSRTSVNEYFINNTIVNNSASTGGGIFTRTSIPEIENNIIWNNTASTHPGIHNEDGTPLIDYSNVQGGFSGTGNINTDPLFADTLYHLLAGSPCIDAGNPDPAYNDIDGTRNDMGAYGGPSPYDPITGLYQIENENKIPNAIYLLQNYPNPFNPVTNIEFSLPKTELVSLKIYNLLGQEVITLVSEKLNAGSYKYSWNASSLASGVYLYKLKAGNFIQTRKMILLK